MTVKWVSRVDIGNHRERQCIIPVRMTVPLCIKFVPKEGPYCNIVFCFSIHALIPCFSHIKKACMPRVMTIVWTFFQTWTCQSLENDVSEDILLTFEVNCISIINTIQTYIRALVPLYFSASDFLNVWLLLPESAVLFLNGFIPNLTLPSFALLLIVSRNVKFIAVCMYIT